MIRVDVVLTLRKSVSEIEMTSLIESNLDLFEPGPGGIDFVRSGVWPGVAIARNVTASVRSTSSPGSMSRCSTSSAAPLEARNVAPCAASSGLPDT